MRASSPEFSDPTSRVARALSRFLTALLLPLLLLRPAFAAVNESPPNLTMSTGRAVVEFAPGRAGLARQAAATVEFAANRILRQLGVNMRGPIRVQLVEGEEAFARACGREMPEWALAAALPDQRIVVKAFKSAPVTANDIHISMVHEMAHLALARAEAGHAERLPLWFHEGVATHISGRQLLMLDRRVFDVAAMHGDLIPLEELAESFPEDSSRAELAYLQSEDFVGWLFMLSPEGLRGIVDRYKAGADFDKAFAEAAGMSVAKAERRWAESRRRRFPWLRMLLRSLTFWSVMALATIAVFLIVRHRARRQHKRWEAEERIFTVLDAEEPPAEEPEEDEPEEEWDPGEPIHG